MTVEKIWTLKCGEHHLLLHDTREAENEKKGRREEGKKIGVRLWEARSRPNFWQNRAASRDASRKNIEKRKKRKATTLKNKRVECVAMSPCIIDRGRANERTPPSPTHTTHPQRILSFFFPHEVYFRAPCHTPTRRTPRHTLTRPEGHIQVQSPACIRSALHFNAPLTAVREKETHSHSRESLIRRNSPIHTHTHTRYTPNTRSFAHLPFAKRCEIKQKRPNLAGWIRKTQRFKHKGKT